MTPDERDTRYFAIRSIGCIACLLFGVAGIVGPQIHHLNFGDRHGGARLGDEYTVGLCPWHHVGQPPERMWKAEAQERMGPSWELNPNAFRERFGTGVQLLAYQNRLIREWLDTFVVPPRVGPLIGIDTTTGKRHGARGTN